MAFNRILHLAKTPVGGGGGGGTPPDTLFGATLIGWYKGDVGTFSNEAGTTAAVNGGPVMCWKNQVGGAASVSYLINDTVGNAPLLTSSGGGMINGVPVVTFNSTNSHTLYTGFSGFPMSATNKASVFVVCQMLTGTQNNGYLMSYIGSAGGLPYDNAGSAGLLIRNGTTNAIFGFRNNTSLSGGAISLATTVAIGMVFSGTQAQTYLNGAALGSATAQTDTFDAVGTLICGEPRPVNTVTGQFWSGPVAEIVVVKDDIVAAAKLAALQAYFVGKWGTM